MKFSFKIQQYQTDAVEAVARVFQGQPYNAGVSYLRDMGTMQAQPQQLSLFTEEELNPQLCSEPNLNKNYSTNAEKEQHIQEAILSIKKRYGKNALLKGANLQECATTIQRNAQIGGHRA